MKTTLLTAAILSFSVMAGSATLAAAATNGGLGSGNPARDTPGATGSDKGSDSSGKEDNQGYMSGPKIWRHFMVRGGNRPIWHGMTIRTHHRVQSGY